MTRSRPVNAMTTMSTIELIFPDGSRREYPAGTTAREIAAAISPSLAKRTVLAKLDERLLDVDNEVVLPVNTNIRVQIAGNDVMHSWFVPSLGVQKYAVIGRLNEVWMNVEKEGTYYGECNQICGVNHSFMPIKIHVVSKDAFAKWVATAKQKFAREDGAPSVRRVASVQ